MDCGLIVTADDDLVCPLTTCVNCSGTRAQITGDPVQRGDAYRTLSDDERDRPEFLPRFVSPRIVLPH